MLQPFQGLSCTFIALLIQSVKFVRIVFKTPHLDRALRPDGQYAALVLEALHQFELGIIYGMALAQQQTQTRDAWFKRKIPVTRSSDCNEHNKEDHS